MDTMITAHSGCEGTPDNSLEYVRFALCLPVDCIEVDVNIGPESLYLSHDAQPVNLQKNCPLLEPVFYLLSKTKKIKINCDLKSYGIERAVWDLAVSCGVADRLIYSGSVNMDNIRAYKPISDHVEVFLNLEVILPHIYKRLEAERRTISPGELAELVRIFKSSGAACININHKFFDDTFFDEVRTSGIPVSLWTVDDEDRISCFLNKGVCNITTRQPNRAFACRQQTGGTF